MAKKLFRPRILPLLLLTIFLGIIFFLKENMSLSFVTRRDRRSLFVKIIGLLESESENLAIEGQVCRIPVLDLNATEILQLTENGIRIVCNKSRDWVEVTGSTAKIRNWVKKKFGTVQCSFTDVIRENDYSQHQGMTTTTHTEYNLEVSDVVTVFCKSANDVNWNKVLVGVRSDQEIFDRASWSKVPEDSLKLNLLMFGFDSVSHNMWKRKLSKTYKYVTNDLNGIALNGYNIIGDGTPQALIPILTGKTELELPETRKRMGEEAHYVNVYPFIWNNFQNSGYVTGWSEDMPHIGTFTFRMKGFDKQPVDHYMRTFYTQIPKYPEPTFCYGENSRFQIVIDFVKNMYEVYKDRPKFVFAFHSEYSHGTNDLIFNADDDTYKWLQDFNRKGYLNNTLLILMSDHGSRYSSYRNTQQGKQEERLPGFIFVFPAWFPKKYPEAYENFKKNADRLSTPFDVHETIKNVLHFEGAGMGNIQNRGISLFKEIPISRSCEDANIEPHWCACLKWESISETNQLVTEAADHLVHFLNSYTLPHRKLCSELRLGKILWSAKLVPSSSVLRYKGSIDLDGFYEDMSDRTKISLEIYELKVSLEPGNMIFEAGVKFYTDLEKFVVTEKEISRINEYKHMTHCIEDADILHHLRKFCNCH